ncbi:MAG TPA: hypothetical protein VKX45_00570 [Bryobacteraceae bacterium]|jgi:hypothetical protein|nr:hypothetical protein [Bryobacteraceae bacterium]
MRLLHATLILAVTSAVFADTVTLKSGRVIEGTYLGGSPRQVRIEVGDQIRNIDVADIARIEFGTAAAPAPRDDDRPEMRRREEPPMPPDQPPAPPVAPAPPPAAAGELGVTLPAGTNLVIRMIDGVDSETARPGQTFAGSLDEPVRDSSGGELIPRGADVVLKLVDAHQSGTFTGRAELALNLQSIRVNGRMVDINTQSVTRTSDSRGQSTAKRGAIGAVGGAVLGGILGGGKGAAAGAGIGAGAGAGSEAVTKGPRVRIPSETRLTFVLDTPVRL